MSARHAAPARRAHRGGRWLLVGVAVVVVGLAGVALRHRGVNAGAPATSGAGPTTTTTTIPLAPLTGLPDPSGFATHHPALTVKIENTPEAMPQWGIDQADVVYEEIVNGGITRLAAVFNSHDPAKIGPIRSVRPTDAQILDPLGGIFAFSGGAPYALAAIASSPIDPVQESTAGTAMFRDLARVAPHNLYGIGAALFRFHGAPVPPHPLFTYRRAGTAPTGALASSVTVPFPSIYPVTWTWDPQRHGYDRTLFGQPVITGTGAHVAPANVLVMWVTYVNGVGTFTSYANLQGSGPVALFSDGHEVLGTWSHTTARAPIAYRTRSGSPLALTPGQTWVELLNAGAVVHVQQ
ncbi:MAG: DUF3048 domain-containing protein [Acidimicrobiales bacterium]